MTQRRKGHPTCNAPREEGADGAKAKVGWSSKQAGKWSIGHPGTWLFGLTWAPQCLPPTPGVSPRRTGLVTAPWLSVRWFPRLLPEATLTPMYALGGLLGLWALL